MRSSSMNVLQPQQSMNAAGSFQGDQLPDPSAITQIKRLSINRRPQQKVDKKNPVKAKEEPEGEAKVTLDEKRAKTNAKPLGRPGENVDVKARKGQASDIRGLPEMLSTNRPVERRIRRRPKTSEQKKSQQDLVPGSNKVNGKAKMLDDQIINHKESLQVQKQDAKNPVKAEEEPEGDAKNAVDKAQAKTNSKTPEPTKDFIHLNGARRGNIRAQRIQGEKSGERMKFLPDPEPSSDKEMQKEDIKGLVESKEELKGDAKVTLDKKQARTNTNFPVHPKENFDVRARRGQASDIRNQAERVRRARIGKRMKFLQDLVPGCNKVSGKAEVLDEIIKYIQSLHLQVELAKKDNKKEPLLGLTESQNSHYIDIEEANSVTDHKAQKKNDIDIEMLGSSETKESNNIDIEKADDIGDHEAKNRSTGACGKVDLEWILLITNFILEFPSIVFDELSSVHKPLYALFAMLISLIAITICMVEFVRKAQKERVIWKWKGTLPWLHYPLESHKPFGTFKDIIGLVCAFGQCIVTSINYAFCLQQVDNPIKFSVWPTFFAIGLLCSKYFGDPEKRAIV